MEEERQSEKVEIVESASVQHEILTPLSLVSHDATGHITESADARLMTVSAGELAFRRTLGQIIDFVIVYAGVFFYFTRSGFVFCSFGREYVHPLVCNLSFLGGWQFFGALVLLSLPYLYLRWYFKVFKNYFTPGEMIVGLGSSCPSLQPGQCSGELRFAFCQLLRVVIAVLYACFAVSWAGIPLGLLFICISGAFGSRWKEIVRYGIALILCNALWLSLLTWSAVRSERSWGLEVVSLCILIGLSLLVIFGDNRPAAGKKVQSPAELSHDMQTRALRDIGKPDRD